MRCIVSCSSTSFPWLVFFFGVPKKNTSSWLSKKLHTKPCQRPFWSLWRHGRGLAGAGDISHREFLAWRLALWCSFLLRSLPVLQQRSSLLVASICSVKFSAWLCLEGWWGWSFISSGTAEGCLSWEVWWLRTGSTGLAILLSARSCCRLSWEQRLHPLCLLGPVLQGCCQLQLTSLSSVIVLQPPLLCEGWGGHPLCLFGTLQYWWISIGLVIIQLRAVFCPPVQYLPFFCEAFSKWSWIVVVFPCFTVVKSFTSQHASYCCSSSNFLQSYYIVVSLNNMQS